MYVWFPLHKLPPLILESQIPPTMEKFIKFLASSYISWLLILAMMITLVLLYFVDSLTGLEFMLSFLGLWIACGLVVAYVKDMQCVFTQHYISNTTHNVVLPTLIHNKLCLILKYPIMKTRTYYVVNGIVCTSLQSAQELKKESKQTLSFFFPIYPT